MSGRSHPFKGRYSLERLLLQPPNCRASRRCTLKKTPRLCIALRNPGVPGLLAGIPISVCPGSSVYKLLWLLRGCHNAANQAVTESPDCTSSLRELEYQKDGAL